MNGLSSIFSNIKGDVSGNVGVTINLDPGSLILLCVLIVMTIVLSHFLVKAIA